MLFKPLLAFSLLCALAQCEERSDPPPSSAVQRTGNKESPAPTAPSDAPATTDSTHPEPEIFFIAIIDSGIDPSHPLFESRFAQAEDLREHLPEALRPAPDADFLGFDLVDNGPTPRDHTGHGTHVAGIVVSESFGNHPDSRARLAVSRTGNKKHSLPRLTIAVTHVTEMKRHGLSVPVVLLPLEYYPERHEAAKLALFEKALQELTDRDTLCICAAGNMARNNDDPSGTKHCYPSDFPFPNILSVAACNESGHLHPLSNYGSTSVDLAAPGFGIDSAGLKGGNTKQSGSSQAAAYVAARAIQLSRSPGIHSAADIKNALLKHIRIHPSLVGRTLCNGYLPRMANPPETRDKSNAQPPGQP